MNDVTVKRLDELEVYRGPHAIEGIEFFRAAKSLGVTAWGMSAQRFAPGCENYPEHDHAKDGQEEVYVVLEGSVTMHMGDESLVLERGTFIRVGPQTKRKIIPGANGATLLAIGSTPGEAYKPRT